MLIGDNVLATDHERIMRAQEYCLSEAEMRDLLANMDEACRRLDAPAAFALLQQAVREFRAADATQDWVVLQN